MNRDRSKDFVIPLNDRLDFLAVQVKQRVDLKCDHDPVHGFPYQPVQVFCHYTWEGFTKQQAWAYLSALEDAVVLAEEWEAERKAQEASHD